MDFSDKKVNGWNRHTSNQMHFIAVLLSNQSITIPRHLHLQILCSDCFSLLKNEMMLMNAWNQFDKSVNGGMDIHQIKCILLLFFSRINQSITIPRHLHLHIQILSSYCLSYCNSLSSISFETESELTHIKSNACYCCSSLESINHNSSSSSSYLFRMLFKLHITFIDSI
jgi:hypothetical protein